MAGNNILNEFSLIADWAKDKQLIRQPLSVYDTKIFPAIDIVPEPYPAGLPEDAYLAWQLFREGYGGPNGKEKYETNIQTADGKLLASEAWIIDYMQVEIRQSHALNIWPHYEFMAWLASGVLKITIEETVIGYFRVNDMLAGSWPGLSALDRLPADVPASWPDVDGGEWKARMTALGPKQGYDLSRDQAVIVVRPKSNLKIEFIGNDKFLDQLHAFISRLYPEGDGPYLCHDLTFFTLTLRGRKYIPMEKAL